MPNCDTLLVVCCVAILTVHPNNSPQSPHVGLCFWGDIILMVVLKGLPRQEARRNPAGSTVISSTRCLPRAVPALPEPLILGTLALTELGLAILV